MIPMLQCSVVPVVMLLPILPPATTVSMPWDRADGRVFETRAASAVEFLVLLSSLPQP